MPIDPSIALQAGRGVTALKDPADIAAEQAQAQMRQIQLQQAQQGMQDDAAYREAVKASAGGGDLTKSLQQRGLGKQAMEAQKFQTDQQKALAERGKLYGEGMKRGANSILADPSEMSAIRTIDMVASQYGFPAQYIDEAKAQIYAAKGDPSKIKQIALGWDGDGDKILGKFSTENLGGVVSTQRVNPATGQLEVAATQQRTQTPDSIASNQQSNINNQRSVSASLANAAATRAVADATRTSATAQRDQNTEMKLSDDYRAQSKDFKAAGDAYRQINSTLDKATTSPAATLAAATKFMKLLDPGSVVRESELGMALQASGVLDRATNYFNILQRGKVLTPTQVDDFKNITNQIYGAAQDGQKAIDMDYATKAKQYGLRPEMIVQELGQNKPAKQAIQLGMRRGGFIYKGGNPNDPKSWEPEK